MITVSALYIYPVKSCRGIACESVRLDGFGLEQDRRFLIVDATGHFLTQRSVPRLALISPTLTAHDLILSAPGAGDFRLPLPNGNFPSPGGTAEVVVWRDTVPAHDLGDAVAAWLRSVVGQRARLVHTGPEFPRRLPRHRVPEVHRADVTDVPVAFADAFPLLALSEESVAKLNECQEPRVGMDRFRPNVVVKGGEPHDEDRWQRVRIGGVEIRSGGDCARCTVTTVDQATGVPGKEPLRSLARYRRSPAGAVIFGQNWIHLGRGTLRVGDAVEVLG